MRISIADAVGQLDELVRLAETGDDVILTREGKAVIRLVPTAQQPKQSAAEIEAILNRIRASAPKSVPGEAARSQDFLYDEDGLPG